MSIDEKRRRELERRRLEKMRRDKEREQASEQTPSTDNGLGLSDDEKLISDETVEKLKTAGSLLKKSGAGLLSKTREVASSTAEQAKEASRKLEERRRQKLEEDRQARLEAERQAQAQREREEAERQAQEAQEEHTDLPEVLTPEEIGDEVDTHLQAQAVEEQARQAQEKLKADEEFLASATRTVEQRQRDLEATERYAKRKSRGDGKAKEELKRARERKARQEEGATPTKSYARLKWPLIALVALLAIGGGAYVFIERGENEAETPPVQKISEESEVKTPANPSKSLPEADLDETATQTAPTPMGEPQNASMEDEVQEVFDPTASIEADLTSSPKQEPKSQEPTPEVKAVKEVSSPKSSSTAKAKPQPKPQPAKPVERKEDSWQDKANEDLDDWAKQMGIE